ncbi:hypothetical protein QBC32DRAFT_119107 [Pseudoneurospora amorphoporcata]|uniref:Uncharacterized protein n=1 Tax=Pseudoneurospora amorphoporcata TaxID=241081 RepID=A0AAN6SAT6_9PEZI|nr:hypothetical protein QBC32DRAFT_119107 [Pseudoneurospora amorphoporcata]
MMIVNEVIEFVLYLLLLSSSSSSSSLLLLLLLLLLVVVVVVMMVGRGRSWEIWTSGGFSFFTSSTPLLSLSLSFFPSFFPFLLFLPPPTFSHLSCLLKLEDVRHFSGSCSGPKA